MDDKDGVSGVRDRLVDGVEEASALTDLPQEEGPGIGGQPASQEIGDDRLGAETGKGEGFAVTVCHSGGLAFGG